MKLFSSMDLYKHIPFTHRLRQLSVLLLAAVFMYTFSSPVYADSIQISHSQNTMVLDIEEHIAVTISWCDKQELADPSQAGTLSSSDWYAFSLGRLNKAFGKDYATSDYIDALQSYIDACYTTSDKLDSSKATEWHRVCLTLAANGITPSIPLFADGTFYRGYTKPLATQGVNGSIWALITLDSLNCDLPADASDTRETIVSNILSSHIAGSGFAFTGTDVSIDITANALTALAPYYLRTTPRLSELSEQTLDQLTTAVEDSLLFLSNTRLSDGGYGSDRTPSSESCSQVLIALTSLGINPTSDTRFAQDNQNVLTALLSYQNEDGGFAHIAGDSSDTLATSQALTALTAYALYCADGSLVYELTDSCAPLTLPLDMTYENYNNQQTISSHNPLVILSISLLVILIVILSLVLLFRHRHQKNH